MGSFLKRKLFFGLMGGFLACSVVAADTFVFTAIPDQDLIRNGAIASKGGTKWGDKTKKAAIGPFQNRS